jgi:hypothetical protein
MEGRRFSEFWALRRKVIEGPVEVRDLPLRDEELNGVAGGAVLLQNPTLSPSAGLGPLQPPGGLSTFAPPYVPVSPVKPQF